MKTNFLMSYTLLAKNADTSGPPESESFNSVKEEIDEFVNVTNEPMWGDSIPNELPNEESKYIIDQITGEDVKVWSKDDLLTPCNSHSIRTSEVFNAGVNNVLIKMKVEEETEDHHIQNENTECMTKIEDVSAMRSSILLELTQEKCDQTGSDTVHSLKTDISEDFNSDKGSKYIINQIKDEIDKEDFLTTWTSHCDKLQKKDHFFSKNKGIKGKKEGVTEILSSIQMEMISSKCDLPTNLENKKCYSCDFCDFSSSWKGALRTHIKSIHLNIRDHKCHLCDYSSSRKPDLQIHIKSVHSKNHKCNLCDYCSSHELNLKQHIKSVHLKVKNHKCDLCDYSSPRKADLRIHITSVHLKLKNYKCNLCNYSSSRKAVLQVHMESVHLKLKIHKCNLCDHSSSRKGSLQQHMKSVHLKLKNHKCDLCDYSSSRKSDLRVHIISAHLKLKNHKCNLCDYSSSWKRALQLHINSVHLKLRNHKCNLCDYSSPQKRTLQHHIKSVHLKLKNHKCDLCDYSSSRKADLQMHMKSVHSKLKKLNVTNTKDNI